MIRAQRFTLAAAIVAAISMTAPRAEAQRPGAGSIQLHLDAQILDLQVFPDRYNQVSLGVGGASLGPGIVYQVADGIIIGTRAAFGFTLIDPVTPGDSVAGSIALLPYLEFVFGQDQIAPFVDVHAGFQAIFPDGFDPWANVIVGARGGVHIFATDSFSVSPWGMLNFLYDGGIERAGFELAAGFSLVGWIGGNGGEAPPAQEPGAYEPAPAQQQPVQQEPVQQQTAPPPPAGNPEQGIGGDY